MIVQATERLIIKIEIQEGIIPGKNHLLTTTIRTMMTHQAAHRQDQPNATSATGASREEGAEASASPTSNATRGITTADMTITATREAGLKWKTVTAAKKAEAVRKTTGAGSVAATIGIDIRNCKKSLPITCRLFLFPEYEVNRQDQKDEPDEMVPAKSLRFEKEQGENHEYDQGDHFLYHFELHE